MKIQIVSAHVQMPTNRLWNHRPMSGPMSISISRCSRSTTTELMSMEASLEITPAALFTTLCPTSKTPITMFHVLVTIRTAQAVLKIHLKNIQVSTSPCILFLSETIWISSRVMTKARITPAIGMMTFSESERIML